MNEIKNSQRTLWLITGMLAGVAIASIWPHEPGMAASNDRSKSFGIATMPVMVSQETEAVIILNYRTGRLVGGILNNKNGKFMTAFYRNVAADFSVGKNAEFTMVAGNSLLPNMGVANMAKGALYIAELRSGKVAAYGVPFNESSRKKLSFEMVPLDFFSFSDAIVE